LRFSHLEASNSKHAKLPKHQWVILKIFPNKLLFVLILDYCYVTIGIEKVKGGFQDFLIKKVNPRPRVKCSSVFKCLLLVYPQ
jgi:hypothetical protein